MSNRDDESLGTRRRTISEFCKDNVKPICVVAAGVGLVAFAASRYRVAATSEYIARTGLGISRVSISKKAVQWPFQTYTRVSVIPHNFTFELSAMSKEKLEFKLPGVFTIGPKDEAESIEKYVTLLDGGHSHLQDVIKGVIEGETRGLAASLDIEEIFNGRAVFRHKIIESVQDELCKFGLIIYNANIKELEDAQGSEYFVHMRQKKRADAENQARKDIAVAKFQGDVSVAEKSRDTRILTAQYEAEATKMENDRRTEIAKSKAEYLVKQAEYDRQSTLAKVEAEKAYDIRASELQKEVENRNIMQRTEKLRSELLSQSIVEAEAKERKADADLYASRKNAEGVQANYEAQAEGLRRLLSCATDPNTVLSYFMLDKEVYPKLAEANARAIQGLQPKITSWTTSGNGSDGSTGNPIGDIMKSLPPLVQTIHDQTGIKPPAWLLDTSSMLQGKQ